jgi:sulfur-oxidizing protein SoxX
MRRWAAAWAVALGCAGATAAAPADDAGFVPWEAVGDGIPRPLAAEPGDAARGRAIVGDRRVGLCLLCHAGPFPDPASQGTIGPDLAGAGSRWSAAQLRLRVADARRLNPATVMPPGHAPGGARVGAAWRGRPVLTAQQVEDVVAFLATLRTP